MNRLTDALSVLALFLTFFALLWIIAGLPPESVMLAPSFESAPDTH